MNFGDGSAKMVMSEDEITRLWRIRTTVMQMLNDRGYHVLESELKTKKSEFIQKYGEGMKREDLFILKELRSDRSDQVFFSIHVLFVDSCE